MAASPCCGCNRRGLCKGCVCVKSEHTCVDCMPSRIGSCHNVPESCSDIVSLPDVQTAIGGCSGSRSLGSQNGSPCRSDVLERLSSFPSSLPSSSLCRNMNEASCQSPSFAHARGSNIRNLPGYEKMAEPNFSWGNLEGPQCVRTISDCYNEVIRWKSNLFFWTHRSASLPN